MLLPCTQARDRLAALHKKELQAFEDTISTLKNTEDYHHKIDLFISSKEVRRFELFEGHLKRVVTSLDRMAEDYQSIKINMQQAASLARKADERCKKLGLPRVRIVYAAQRVASSAD